MLEGLVSGRDLDSFVVNADDTLTEVLARLRHNRQRFAVVLGSDGQFAGTIIDSDVRRAALAGVTLDAPARQVASKAPAVIGPDASAADVEALMRAHLVQCLPVVEDGKMLGVCVREPPEVTADDAIAVIMAGGRGNRLRPLTDKVPKPLLKMGRASIIERIIQSLAGAGIKEVFVAINYKAELFETRLGTGENLGVTIRYLREEVALGTAGPLSLLPGHVNGLIVVANGDLVTTVDFVAMLDFHRRHRAALTVTGVPYLSPIPYGVLEVAGHHLLSIEEKPVRSDLCSAGIYILDPLVRNLLPKKCPVDMPELIAEALAQGLPVSAFPILETWIDIGGPAEFERALMQFAVGDEE